MTRLEIFEKVHERLDVNSNCLYLCNEIASMYHHREITKTEASIALKFLHANRPTPKRFEKFHDYEHYIKDLPSEAWWHLGHKHSQEIEVIEQKKAFVYELIRKLRYKKLKG